MGFTQRQAAGKFTSDEASDFIDRLQNAEYSGEPIVASRRKSVAIAEELLRKLPAERLAEELERRGWVVIPGPPPS